MDRENFPVTAKDSMELLSYNAVKRLWLLISVDVLQFPPPNTDDVAP